MKHRIYNLKRDKPDHRDRLMAMPPVSELPPALSLRAMMPPVYDQGELGSCTANAIAAALDAIHAMDHPASSANGETTQGMSQCGFFGPSRLFIYYFERDAEGTVAEDAGGMLRDGIKVINRRGACRETTWPYDISQFKNMPPETAIVEAKDYKAIQYERVPVSTLMIKSMIALNLPVVCGIQIYESFESDAVVATGFVPMPNTLTEQCLGGHAVVIVGYDDSTRRFTLRNSWGAAWGDAGYFTLPYEYIQNPGFTSDAWAIQKAE
jgi:C1A family cysteine protease